jgi:hypothetical protein
MKKLTTLIIALLFISCEPEAQTEPVITQQPCMCNLAKFYIPRIDQKIELPPHELDRDYTYFENVELDCVTGMPIVLPTPNAMFIKCED